MLGREAGVAGNSTWPGSDDLVFQQELIDSPKDPLPRAYKHLYKVHLPFALHVHFTPHLDRECFWHMIWTRLNKKGPWVLTIGNLWPFASCGALYACPPCVTFKTHFLTE